MRHLTVQCMIVMFLKNANVGPESEKNESNSDGVELETNVYDLLQRVNDDGADEAPTIAVHDVQDF